MRIVPNTGADRVVDLAWPWLQASHRIDLASEALSHFAFGELAGNLARTTGVRLVLPPDNTELDLLGSAADRAARNRSFCGSAADRADSRRPPQVSSIGCWVAGWLAVLRHGSRKRQRCAE